MADTQNLITPIGRVSFPQLFLPKKDDRGVERYSLTLIFDKAAQDTAEFRALVKAADDLRTEIAKRAKKSKEAFKLPFRRGEEKSHLAGYEEGTIFIAMTSTRKPGVVDQRGKIILDPADPMRVKVAPDQLSVLTPDAIYPGCYGRCTVQVYERKVAENPGISIGLGHFQFARDGERLGSDGANPIGTFGVLETSASGDDLSNLLG